jgi:hypothetical protein
MTVTVYNCWFHYNKAYPEWGPLDVLIVHYQGRKIPCPEGLVVHVATASVKRETQPRVVMVCIAKEIIIDPSGVVHIW